MPGPEPRGANRPKRRTVLSVECLSARLLLSGAGLTHSLGPYVGNSPFGPRVLQPSQAVNPHLAISQFLPTILGPELVPIQAVNQADASPHRRILVESILARPFVRSMIAEGNTYLLLRSSAFNGLIGSETVPAVVSVPVANPNSPAEIARQAALAVGLSYSFAGQSGAAFAQQSAALPTGGVPQPTSPPPAPIPPTQAQVTPQAVQEIVLSVPAEATVITIGAGTAFVQVLPVGSIPGFFAEVPISNVRILDPGPPLVGTVAIPIESVPPGFPVPTTSTIAVGTFAPTYESTGPLLGSMLNAGIPRVAPNAPADVPGLRLASSLPQGRIFPNAMVQNSFRRMMRLAVQRDVFTLDASQTQALTDGLNALAEQVVELSEAGAFTPAIPPPPPPLPAGTLSGTLQVSAGVLRELGSVDPAVSGLPLPSLGNFPGRLDVGYVFDRAGNYGIIVTVRGPLDSATPDLTSDDLAGGDLRIEITDAPGIAALGGVRATEGVFLGSITSASLESSRYANGVSAFSTAIGTGLGLEYGTGVGVSQVIPLGNVFSLIPSAPRRN